MNRRDFFIELQASIWTLAGMYIGSTTLAGASCYAVSRIFWFALMFRRRMWGLAPLNVATAIVAAVNIGKAMR